MEKPIKRGGHKKIKLGKQKKQRMDLLGRVLELPPGIVGGGAHIEMFSNREAVVDGCRGVLHFDDGEIKLNTGSGTLVFRGREMVVVSFEGSQAVVKGYILSVEFGLL